MLSLASPQRGLGRRHLMVALCALCCFLNYTDRVNASVAIIPMAKHFKWSVRTQSHVLSAFFIGYLPMQIVGAELCRKFGGRSTLGWAVVWWSVFTVITPFCADLGLAPLLACRLLMGLGEALTFPGIYHFLSGWVPASERSRSTAVIITGIHIGSTTALLLSPHLLAIHSWRLIFWFFGFLGVAFFAVWMALAEDFNPEKHYTEIPDGEGNTNSGEDGRNPIGSLQVYRAIFGSKACFAVIVASFANNWCHYTVMAWLPSYMSNVFKVKATDLGFTFMPYLVMAFATNCGGGVADYLQRQGVRLITVRRIMTSVGNIGAALFIFLFGISNDPYQATGLIAVALGMQVLNTGGYESSYLDISDPKYTGSLKAVANTLASLAGLLCMPFSAFILRVTGSWRVVFQILALFYLAGFVVYVIFISAERELTDELVASYSKDREPNRK